MLSGQPSLTDTLFQVFGGLGLFLFGLRLLSDTLQKTVGDSIKRVLGTLTKRPIYGLALGALVTGIIQSSSATTVMVVGLINAGLMDFFQSVGVILGSNIGSTILPQIVALSPEKLALPAIGFGMVMHLFFTNAKIKEAGLAFVTRLCIDLHVSVPPLEKRSPTVTPRPVAKALASTRFRPLS